MTGGKEHCVLHTLIESISNSGHKIKIISNIVSNVSNYDVLKLPDVKTMKKTSSYSNKNIRNILYCTNSSSTAFSHNTPMSPKQGHNLSRSTFHS